MRNARLTRTVLLLLIMTLLFSMAACTAVESADFRVAYDSEETFTINAAARRFRSVRVNGIKLDPEAYTVTEDGGKTVVTLAKGALDSFAGHKLTVSFFFNNGKGTIKLDLRNYEPAPEPEPEPEPVQPVEEPAPAVEEAAAAAQAENTVKTYHVVERTGILADFFNRYYTAPEGIAIDFVADRADAAAKAGDKIVTVPGTRAIAAAFADCKDTAEIAERAQGYAEKYAGFRLNINGIYAHAKEYVSEKFPGVTMDAAKAYVRYLLTPKAEPAAEAPAAEAPAAEAPAAEAPAAEAPAAEAPAAGEEPAAEEPAAAEPAKLGVHVVEKTGILADFFNRYYAAPEGTEIDFVADKSDAEAKGGDYIVTVPGTRTIAAAFADCKDTAEIAERAQGYAEKYAGFRLNINGIYAHAKEYVSEKFPGMTMDAAKAYVRYLLTPKAEAVAEANPEAEPAAEEPAAEAPAAEEPAAGEPAAEVPVAAEPAELGVHVVEKTGILGDFFGRYYDAPEGTEIDFVADKSDAEAKAGDYIVTVPGTRAIAAAFADCKDTAEIAERAQGFAEKFAGIRLNINGIYSHAKEYVSEKFPGVTMDAAKAYVRYLLG